MPSVPLLVKDRFCPAGFEPLTIDTTTGIRRYYREEGDNVRVVTVQPVDEILDQNQRERYDARGTLASDKKLGVLAARIPVNEYWALHHHECGDRLDPDDAQKAIKKALNSSPGNNKLRVAEFNL